MAEHFEQPEPFFDAVRREHIDRGPIGADEGAIRATPTRVVAESRDQTMGESHHVFILRESGCRVANDRAAEGAADGSVIQLSAGCRHRSPTPPGVEEVTYPALTIAALVA